jgi:hypothetical protein
MVLRRQLSKTALALLCAMTLGAVRLHAEPKADSNAIHDAPCVKQANGHAVTLEITPRPVKAMQPLLFKVKVDPADNLPSTLTIDLSMPGMYMGENRMKLVRTAPGVWEGKGVIVRCMSGRKLWQIMVLSPELGNPAFSFDVRD